MSTCIRIGLIGDFDAEVVAHRAILPALELAARAEGIDVTSDWIETNSLTGNIAARLAPYHSLWCVPKSPYNNTQGVLTAIQFARESGMPFLGTCAGFQHAVLEFARNVAGIPEAEHAELNPRAAALIVAPLSCSLVEKPGIIYPVRGSSVHVLYGVDNAVEGYHCNYGLNDAFLGKLTAAGMRVSAVDDEGATRAFELPTHPFFVCTLFQPERSSLKQQAHPLISGFVRAAMHSRS